jgi:hypothetical protein
MTPSPGTAEENSKPSHESTGPYEIPWSMSKIDTAADTVSRATEVSGQTPGKYLMSWR